jgi:hypothetical protein
VMPRIMQFSPLSLVFSVKVGHFMIFLLSFV